MPFNINHLVFSTEVSVTPDGTFRRRLIRDADLASAAYYRPEQLSSLLAEIEARSVPLVIPAGTTMPGFRLIDPINGGARNDDCILIEDANAVLASVLSESFRSVPRIVETSPGHLNLVFESGLYQRGFRAYLGHDELRFYADSGESAIGAGFRDQRAMYTSDFVRTLRMMGEFDAARAAYMREGLRLRTPIPEPTTQARSGTGDFVAFFHKRKPLLSRMVGIPNTFQDITILPSGTVSSRRWGIEIEAVDIDGIQTPEYWRLKDDGSLRGVSLDGEEHGEYCESRDTGDFDDCDCDYGYEGRTETGEWVSPILRSVHSRGLKHLTTELEHRGVNSTAGIHVHVEASDLTPKQAARVVMLYSFFEDLFEHEYDRDTRDYCRSVHPESILRTLREASKIEREGGSVTSLYGTERYLSVNLQALSAHGTIEFRAMGPRYDYDHLVRWATFCREMVNLAKSNVPHKVWSKVTTFRGLIELFSVFGKETPVPAWVAEGSPTVVLPSERRRLPNRSMRGDVFDEYYRSTPVLASSGHEYY